MDNQIIIFNSDIDRLVLAYLKDQNLNRAAHIFCKTSPNLEQEFTAIKYGLRAHNFFPKLEEIIHEYVQIAMKVDELQSNLPSSLRSQLKSGKLSDKVNYLLERAVELISDQNVGNDQTGNSKGGATGSTSDITDKKRTENKRKRLHDTSMYSSDEHNSSKTPHKSKRQRILKEQFCFPSDKLRNFQNLYKSGNTCDTELDLSENLEDEEEEETEDSKDEEEDDGEETDADSAEGKDDNEDVFLKAKPSKQSTPHLRGKPKFNLPPMLPQMLADIDFPTKLANNINEWFGQNDIEIDPTASPTDENTNENPEEQATVETEPPTEPPTEPTEEQFVASSVLFDRMIKNVMENTEKDPIFDEILAEVVGSATTTKAVQCNMDAISANNENQIENAVRSPTANAQIVPQTPKTPLVIRNAMAAVNTSTVSASDLQLPINTIPANASFSQIIDPNFSISKFIMLNPTDSAQKNQAALDQNSFSITADQLLSQFNNGNNTEQYFLTSDGLIPAYPCIINNEVLTHQMQTQNVNMEPPRIEITIPPEALIMATDDVPKITEESCVAQINAQNVAASNIAQNSVQNIVLQSTSHVNMPKNTLPKVVPQRPMQKGAPNNMNQNNVFQITVPNTESLPATKQAYVLECDTQNGAVPSTSQIISKARKTQNFAQNSTQKILLTELHPQITTQAIGPPSTATNVVHPNSTQKNMSQVILVSAAVPEKESENKSQKQEELPQCSTLSKISTSNAIAPSSLDSRIIVERSTPSTNGIVNKGFGSLSTPRKRASHVRHLTFSPRSVAAPTAAGTTPLSSRRYFQSKLESIPRILEGDLTATVPEKTVINKVEILPALPAKIKCSATTVTSNTSGSIDVNCNESSNSCNVPPLFAGEESSNLTVITRKSFTEEADKKQTTGKEKKKEIVEKEIKEEKVDKVDKESKGAKEDKVGKEPKEGKVTKTKVSKKITSSLANNTDNTPKRKQVRKNAVRSCKRRLTKSPEPMEEKKEKENIAGSKATEVTKNVNDTEKYVENGNQSPENADDMEEWNRMRSATGNNWDSHLREINSKKTANQPIKKEFKKKKIRRNKDGEIISKAKRKEAKLAQIKLLEAAEEEETANPDVNIEGNTNKKEESSKKRLSKDKSKEFNIKIPTPQKSVEKTRASKDGTTTKPKEIEDHQDMPDVSAGVTATSFIIPHENSISNATWCKENEKRTANIAHLLETPYKATNMSGFVPPTPGICEPSLDTPMSKLKPNTENMHSASYLFGSLTKSEMGTPMLSAITPGFKYIFGSGEGTPRSAPASEHKSAGGSSYYKPDECEDANQQIDEMARDSAHKKQLQKEKDQQDQEGPSVFEPQSELNKAKFIITEDLNLCVEIPIETIAVESTALTRIKSSELIVVESQAKAHYKLADGIPEDVEENSSSSSSSSSSSASGSSSSGSDSSSSASHSSSNSKTNSSSSPNDDTKSDKCNTTAITLDNLSEINSSEDETWQKTADDTSKKSELVDNEGEVRYPVRSWLTPRKALLNMEPSVSTMHMRISYKSADLLNTELEEKRARTMKILKRNEETKKPPPTPKQAMTRGRQILHDASKPSTTTSPSEQQRLQTKDNYNSSLKKKQPASPITPPTCSRPLDVLTALQLSAKKQSPTKEENPILRSQVEQSPPLGNVDDNAVSTIFPGSSINLSKKDKIDTMSPFKSISSTVAMKASPKKCVQIEALPEKTRGRRASVRQQNIVRAKVGLKGKINPTTTTLKRINESETKSPKKSSPDIKVESSTLAVSPKAVKKRDSPRLTKKKDTKIAAAERMLGRRVTPVVNIVHKGSPAHQILCKKKAQLQEQSTKEVEIVHKRHEEEVQNMENQYEVEESNKEDAKSEEQSTKNSTTTQPITSIELISPATDKEEEEEEDMLAKCKTFEESNKEDAKREDQPTKNSTTTQPITSIELISHATDEEEEEEEDMLAKCKIISNCSNYFDFVYTECDDKVPKSVVPSLPHTKDFQMVIDIGNTEHTLSVNQEILLVNTEMILLQEKPIPKEIRNIPKKRKIRISSSEKESGHADGRKIVTSLTTLSTVEEAKVVAKERKESKKDKPKIKVQQEKKRKGSRDVHTDKKQLSADKSEASKMEDKNSKADADNATSSSSVPKSASTTTGDNIIINDIESILSHLHGK